MRHKTLAFATASVAGFVLVACNAQQAGPSSGASDIIPTNATTLLNGSPARDSSKAKAASTLFALNMGGQTATVTVYSGGGTKLVRTISLSSLNTDGSYRFYMTANKSNLLYVEQPATQSNPGTLGKLTIYADNGGSVIGTASLPQIYYAPTADGAGNIYTACGFTTVCEFDKSGKTVRTIPLSKYKLTGDIRALATNVENDLVIVANGAVVIGPKSDKAIWTIFAGKAPDGIVAAAFDPSGDLYLAGGNGHLFVFPPNAKSPSMTVKIERPITIACDPSGNIYVLELDQTTSQPLVAEYASGGSSPIKEITAGLYLPESMALDVAGNVDIANSLSSSGNGTVTQYAAGTGKLVLTVTDGIDRPPSIAVSP